MKILSIVSAIEETAPLTIRYDWYSRAQPCIQFTNCIEWFFDHPRFGVIPCERTTEFVAAGEELFLDYEYDPYNCPAWFKEAIIQVRSGHLGLEILVSMEWSYIGLKILVRLEHFRSM